MPIEHAVCQHSNPMHCQATEDHAHTHTCTHTRVYTHTCVHTQASISQFATVREHHEPIVQVEEVVCESSELLQY